MYSCSDIKYSRIHAFIAQKKKELEEEIHTEENDDVLTQQLATTIAELKECQEEVKSNVEFIQCTNC